MLGATLRVKLQMADLCRASMGLSILGLDLDRRFIDVLSIARGQWKDRYSVGVTCSPTAHARPSSR
jgi:hypothetical protein